MASLYQPHDQQISNTDAVVLPGDKNPMEAYEAGKQSAFNLKLANFELSNQRLDLERQRVADAERKFKLSDYSSAFKQLDAVTRNNVGGLWQPDINKEVLAVSDRWSREWQDTQNINSQEAQKDIQHILIAVNKAKGIYQGIDKYAALEAKSYPGLDASKLKAYMLSELSDGIDKNGNLIPKPLDQIGNIDDIEKKLQDDPKTLPFYDAGKAFSAVTKTFATDSQSNTSGYTNPFGSVLHTIAKSNKGNFGPDDIAPTADNFAALATMASTTKGGLPIANEQMYDAYKDNPVIAQWLHLNVEKYNAENHKNPIAEDSKAADILKRRLVLQSVAPQLATKTVSVRKSSQTSVGYLLDPSKSPQEKADLIKASQQLRGSYSGPTPFTDIILDATGANYKGLNDAGVPFTTHGDAVSGVYRIYDLSGATHNIKWALNPVGKYYSPDKVWMDTKDNKIHYMTQPEIDKTTGTVIKPAQEEILTPQGVAEMTAVVNKTLFGEKAALENASLTKNPGANTQRSDNGMLGEKQQNIPGTTIKKTLGHRIKTAFTGKKAAAKPSYKFQQQGTDGKTYFSPDGKKWFDEKGNPIETD